MVVALWGRGGGGRWGRSNGCWRFAEGVWVVLECASELCGRRGLVGDWLIGAMSTVQGCCKARVTGGIRKLVGDLHLLQWYNTRRMLSTRNSAWREVLEGA